MVKKLTKHGNSLALVIDKPILDLLKIDADTPLEVATDGQSLIVRRASGGSDSEAFQQALTDVNRQYGSVLRKLAK